MKLFAAVAITATTLLSTAAFAATVVPFTKIQVSLDGEASQPMKVALDVAQVKAGVIEFDVKNDAISTDHEVILIKLQKEGQIITANAKTHRIDEAKFKTMGEVGGLKPSDTGVLKVTLAAGDYVLVCNHKSHFELGMYTPFTVTK
jgi:uncharacterized cupredoxin-like copper-binding protein